MDEAAEQQEKAVAVADDKEAYRPDAAVVVDEKTSDYKWTKTKRRAAEMMATCRYGYVEAAGRLDVRVGVLRAMMKEKEFLAEVQRLIPLTGLSTKLNQLQTLKATSEKLIAELISRPNLKDLEAKDLIRLQNQTLREIREVEKQGKEKSEEDTIDRAIIVQIYQNFKNLPHADLDVVEQGQADILKLAQGAGGVYAPPETGDSGKE